MAIYTGNANANTIQGSRAGDYISGLNGDDVLYGNDGQDACTEGTERIFCLEVSGAIGCTAATATTLHPFWFYDYNGTFSASYEKDTIDGGYGFDTVQGIVEGLVNTRAGATWGLTVDLQAHTLDLRYDDDSLSSEIHKYATLYNIEGVVGTRMSDRISGDANRNTFEHGEFVGANGNGVIDIYDGRGGVDGYFAASSFLTGYKVLPAGTAPSGVLAPFEIAYGTRAAQLAAVFNLPTASSRPATVWPSTKFGTTPTTTIPSIPASCARNSTSSETSSSTRARSSTTGCRARPKTRSLPAGLGKNTIGGGGGLDFVDYHGITDGTLFTNGQHLEINLGRSAVPARISSMRTASRSRTRRSWIPSRTSA